MGCGAELVARVSMARRVTTLWGGPRRSLMESSERDER